MENAPAAMPQDVTNPRFTVDPAPYRAPDGTTLLRASAEYETTGPRGEVVTFEVNFAMPVIEGEPMSAIARRLRSGFADACAAAADDLRDRPARPLQ